MSAPVAAPAPSSALLGRCSATVIEGEQGEVRIPSWVVDLESFRRWVDSDEVDDKIRLGYLDGEIWVNMSKEQLFTHNRVKTAYTVVMAGMVEGEQLGYYFSDGVRLSNLAANFSVNPDAVFASWDALRLARIRLVAGKQHGFTELEGTPDMVLEVMSDSSVEKDDDLLRILYWQAGTTEYWLVDVRGGKLRFDILHRGKKGFVATRRQSGWLKSAVFGRSFQLRQGTDPLGHPRFVLAVRD
jgi:Uma2 family endonuclease